MTVTRVSRTKRSSDCAVGTLEFEFKEDSRKGRVSDWLRIYIYIYIYIKTLAMVGFLASLLYRTVS